MSNTGTTTRTKASAVIRGERLTPWQPRVERSAGALLLMASFLGSIVAFNGGWNATFNESWRPYDWTFSPFAVVVGFILQTVCTLVEWIYSDRRTRLRYLIALSIDAGSSLYGFLQVLFPPMLALLIMYVPVWIAVSFAGLCSGIVVLLLAILPEYILVD